MKRTLCCANCILVKLLVKKQDRCCSLNIIRSIWKSPQELSVDYTATLVANKIRWRVMKALNYLLYLYCTVVFCGLAKLQHLGSVTSSAILKSTVVHLRLVACFCSQILPLWFVKVWLSGCLLCRGIILKRKAHLV